MEDSKKEDINFKIERQKFQLHQEGYEKIAEAISDLKEVEKPEVQKVELMGAEIITIRGKQGEKGEKGERGEKGDSIKGDKGDKGADSFVPGAKGEKGDKGDKGDSIKGARGEQGVKGDKGDKGDKGNDGSPDSAENIIAKLIEMKKPWLPFEALIGYSPESRGRTIRNGAVSSLRQLTDVILTGLTQDANGNYILGSGAGGVAWGAITGTLSDQTDLQTALNAKLNLTGGTLTGNLLFSPDNTYDIGTSGATRPRTGYFGTSLDVGSGSNITSSTINAGSASVSGAIQAFNSGSVKFYAGAGQVILTSAGFYAIGSSATNVFSQDVYLNRQGVGIFGVGTSGSNALGSLNLLNLTATGVVSVPNGSQTAPSLSVGQANSGMYLAAVNTIGIASGAAVSVAFSGNTMTLGQWGSTQTIYAASGGAGNANRAGIALNIGSGQSTGSGVAGALNFQITPAGGAGSSVNAYTTAWSINTSGHFVAGTDNTYDIGASLATRPKALYTAGLTYLGKPTAGGNTQQLNLGHNGTTTSSADGVAQIRFNSQFDNYPFTMGAEGNGYNFIIRQSNGGQGTFQWSFGTISTVAYALDLSYVTDHYEQIFTGKWLSSFTGTGTTGAYYGFKNTVSANSTTVMYDTFRIERGQGNGFYPVSNDPIVSFFAGDSAAAITAHNRYVARINRLGFLGIGTTNTYAAPTTMQQAAITIDMGVKTGLKMNDGTTALQVRTVGSSTTVVCLGAVNGELALGLIVGTRITANGLTRTVVSITNSSTVVVDSAVNWDNGGLGYNFTYTNPYVSLQDGATKYFQVDATGATKVRVGTTTSKQAIAGGIIFKSSTTVPNSGTTETDLYSHSLDANTFGADNESVEGAFSVSTLGSATATTQNRLYFAGTLIYDSGALGLSVASDFRYVVEIIRESSTVVKVSVTSATTTATAAPYTVYTRITGLTLSNANILKITGTRAGVGAASADINGTMSTGKWFPAAQ